MIQRSISWHLEKMKHKKRLCWCFAFLFFITNAYASNADIQELIQHNRQQANYLGVLKQLRENRATYESSPIIYYGLLADYESFLGLHEKALTHEDMALNVGISTKSSQSKFVIEEHQLKNAKDAILEASKMHQVIFINEAHHSPRHRAFTLSLLQDLYNQGFRYFAAETFDETDHDVNQRGYPLSLKTGYYTDEPIYGELVREARKIGYQIIAYEDYSSNCDPFHDSSPEYCMNLREEGQAKNLYERVFKIEPNAKLLVHAGWGHIAKQEGDGWVPMAIYFERLTGIEPFSIDQTIMSEHSHREYENTIFKQIAESGQLKENSILLNRDGSTWLPLEKGNPYDLIVFQPRTIYKNHRPAWLFEIEQRKQFTVSGEICKNVFPCVIEAFKQNEGTDSVPIDRFLITKKQPISVALMSGTYIIRAKNEFGEILSLEYDVTL